MNSSVVHMDLSKGILLLWVTCSLMTGCDKEPVSDTIYFNSFEHKYDTVGWEGGIVFYHDAPIHAGDWSAYISGGCVVPHAWFYLGPFDEDCELTLMCFGKDLERGGGIQLSTEDHSSTATISINNPEWTFYSTDELVYCPAGKRVRVELMSGGFIPSAMLVDKLIIIRN